MFNLTMLPAQSWHVHSELNETDTGELQIHVHTNKHPLSHTHNSLL